MLTLGRDSRPWPRPPPPQPPPRARSMTLRPPRPPPAPSWLQHHLRDRGRGEEPGGGASWKWAGPVEAGGEVSSRVSFGLCQHPPLPCFSSIHRLLFYWRFHHFFTSPLPCLCLHHWLSRPRLTSFPPNSTFPLLTLPFGPSRLITSVSFAKIFPLANSCNLMFSLSLTPKEVKLTARPT